MRQLSQKSRIALLVGLGVLLLLGVAIFVNRRSRGGEVIATSSPSPTSTLAGTASVSPTTSVSPSASSTPSSSPVTSAEHRKKAAQYYQEKNYTQAVGEYKLAISGESNKKEQAALWNLLGNSYRENKQPTEAIAAYKKASELDPALITAYSNWSTIYVGQGDKEKARGVLENGLQANPDNQELKQALSALDIPTGGVTP